MKKMVKIKHSRVSPTTNDHGHDQSVDVAIFEQTKALVPVEITQPLRENLNPHIFV